jgi:hypothetical protein
MRSRFFCHTMAFLAVGLSVSQPAWGEAIRRPQPTEPRRLAQDVALQAGGLLTGQVLDSDGKAKSGVDISLKQMGKTIAHTASDPNGEFQFSSVKAGVYQIETAHGGGVYRLWAPQTAPPAAQQIVRVSTSDSSLIRAQNACPGEGFSFAGPAVLVLGGLGGLLFWALDEDDDSSHNSTFLPTGPAS